MLCASDAGGRPASPAAPEEQAVSRTGRSALASAGALSRRYSWTVRACSWQRFRFVAAAAACRSVRSRHRRGLGRVARRPVGDLPLTSTSGAVQRTEGKDPWGC